MVATLSSPLSTSMTLEEWAIAPPSGMEWVDGNLVEKKGMTLLHSRIQSRIGRLWGNYVESSGVGGEVYTEVPCQTLKQGRRPDIAYLTPDLLAQYGELPVLLQSFPLIAEVISPTDLANEVFAKAQEYLGSGCQEVWLVFTEEKWIVVITNSSRTVYAETEILTSHVLSGFAIAVNDLLG